MRNMLRSIAAAILLVLASTAGASAQCSGQAPANTYCGNPTGALALPGWKPISGLPLTVGAPVTGGSPSASYQSFLTNNNGVLANGHVIDIGCGIACAVGRTNNINIYPINTSNGIQIAYGTGAGNGEGGSITFWTRNPAGAAPPANQEMGFVQANWFDGTALTTGAPPALVFMTTELQTAIAHGAGVLFQATTRGQATARGEACISEGLTVALMSGSCTSGLGIGTINSSAGTYDTSVRVLSSVNPTMQVNQNAVTKLIVVNSTNNTGAIAEFQAVSNVASVEVGAAATLFSVPLLAGRSYVFANSPLLLGASGAASSVIFAPNSVQAGQFLTGLAVGPSGTADPAAGVVNVSVGFRVGNAATSGNVLRGNGTSFVSSTLAPGDLSGLGAGVATAAGNGINTNGGFPTGTTNSVAAGAIVLGAGSGTAQAGLADVATGALLASGGVGSNPSYCTACTITTSLTTPIYYGGTAAGSTLTLASTSGAGTTDALVIQTGSQVERARVLSGGNVNIGASGTAASTSSLLAVNLNTGTPIAPPFNGIQIVGANSNAAALTIDTFVNSSDIYFRGSGGTQASPAATPAALQYAAFGGQTYDGTAYQNNAFITFNTINQTSGSDRSGLIKFFSTASGSTTLTENVRIQGSGGLSIGSGVVSTDPGAGGLIANGATIRFTALAADTAQVDATVCRVAASGLLVTGTGALGICLGTSGAQFKTAFAPMVGGLEEIVRLNFQNYRYLDGFGDSGARTQYGLTAQDVDKVLPDLVRYDASGTAINYDSGALLFIGLRAIQQLKADNDNLRLELSRKKG